MNDWQQAQAWEAGWWGDCANTYGEEEKQLAYAQKMGLRFFHDGKTPWNINVGDKRIVDIGGGPVSLLLKCVGNSMETRHVWEPMELPEWVVDRYHSAGIACIQGSGEELNGQWDEAWIYNVLQHCQDPEQVIRCARECAKVIRLFEWIGTPANEGHPHTLTQAKLDEWLEGRGTVEVMNEPTLKGKAYFGVFGSPEEPDHFRFHFPGLVHLPISETYMGCAFTQKIVKLSKMLLSLGHEVYLYGAEGSDAPCTEFIQTHTLEDIRRTWGDNPPVGELGYDWHKGNFRHDFNTKRTPLTGRFMLKCAKEINARKRQDDFLLLSQGQYHKPIADAVKLWLTCEPGVGYRGSFAKYRADRKSVV